MSFQLGQLEFPGRVSRQVLARDFSWLAIGVSRQGNWREFPSLATGISSGD